MPNTVMTAVYNQFSTTYLSKKTAGRYDTHKPGELRTLCSSMAKVNRDAPLYLLDTSKEAKQYVIALKEEARDLHNTILSSLGEVEESAFHNKIAYSSNENIVSAKYIGAQNNSEFFAQQDSSSEGSVISANGEIPTYEIEVMALASPQINIGSYVPSKQRGLAEGEYSFDINVNGMGYEFQFNVNESDTNLDIQKRLSRLINNSRIGLNADAKEEENGNSFLYIESAKTGIDYGQSPRIFSISDDDTSKKAGAVSYFGLNYIAKEASNAHFTVNGIEASAASNHFILQNNYEITLNGISQNEGQTTVIGVKPDTEALQENISNLVGGYNTFLKAIDQYKGIQPQICHLLTEITHTSSFYQKEMAVLGIMPAKEGTLEINKEQLEHSIIHTDSSKALASLQALKSFSQYMLHKSSQISLNPVSYMNKTIVAYKNPANQFLNPYLTSAYSGMFFNNYC